MYRTGKGHLKLTPEEVRQIRFGLYCGWSPQELADVYGVSVISRMTILLHLPVFA